MSVRESIHTTQRRRYLHYYIHDSSDALRFELAGWLSKDTASDLEQAWRTASTMIGERRVIFDLSRLAGIDQSGLEALRGWICRGALLGANSQQARERLETITNQPVAVFARAAADPRRRPLRAIPTWVAAFLVFVFSVPAAATTIGLDSGRPRAGREGGHRLNDRNPLKVSAPTASGVPQNPSIS
jgi:ABC-type transporter Mla MlaB component